MNSFTYNELFNTCVRFRGKYFYLDLFIFHKQNSLEWFKILKTLTMDMDRRKTLLRN